MTTDKKPAKKQSAKALAIAPTPEDRAKKIAALVAQANMAWGKGALGTLKGKHAVHQRVRSVLPTGSIGLDAALGVGGWPGGRIIEIFGPEGSGKTTLTLHAVAECQRRMGVAAFVDAEHALDPVYAEAIGVDLENFLISQPDNGEQALDIVDNLISSGKTDLVVVDSVSALVPKAELEGDMGDHHPGAQARLMSQAMRKLTAAVGKSDAIVIFINQIRMKIGVTWGSPETTSGGNALKFYASVRLDIRRIGGIKKGDRVIGNRVKVEAKKNKVSPPFRKCEFDLIFGKGIGWEGELIDYGTDAGIIRKSGSWYAVGDERIGQGREIAKEFLREHPDIAEEIRGQIVDHLKTAS